MARKDKQRIANMAGASKTEEQQRVAKALENVQKWQEEYGGFSGGFRVIHQAADGRVTHVHEEVVGDPVVAKKIIEGPPQAPVVEAPLVIAPIAAPPTELPKAREPRHWLLAWLFNLISVEK